MDGIAAGRNACIGWDNAADVGSIPGTSARGAIGIQHNFVTGKRTLRSRFTCAIRSSRAVAFASRRLERLAGPRMIVIARRNRRRSASGSASSVLRSAPIDSRNSVVARTRSTKDETIPISVLRV